MTKQSDDLYLRDMLQYAREARELARAHSAESFANDRTAQLALTYLLQIVGETATRISEERRATLPELQWQRMRGMRNRLVHAYGSVSYDLVWDVVATDLPELIAMLERIIPPEPPSA